MNPVEIEEAISRLAEQPFDAAEFPYAFLEAFDNKETTIKRLRKGDANKTDIEGAVLQHNNIHMAVCPVGEVLKTLEKLKNSPATTRHKAKYILATDGEELQAEDIIGGDTIACAYKDFPNHFGFFLPLAGITTVKQIRESTFDIRATSRLNRLYLELIKDNPEWGTAERRHDMNHFMARLIFCFFAEDTDIFNGKDLFTTTIEKMSAGDSAITHQVMSELFRAMNTKREHRAQQNVPRWADVFPYVNGGLFSGSTDVPRFSKIARNYLLHVGHLEWQKINPDIFGSMIQAIADDDERNALGMHYTSVPNILKVLNPLFLDDLRAKLEEAGDNPRMLLNLRKRISKIRVFDPACGSGNFLVIAYKQMREIEAEINTRRGEADRYSDIPLTNFRGIELKDFPAEIARLALIIAKYQCNVQHLGALKALEVFLPLEKENWIICGNALRLDWLSICPPTGTGVKITSGDMVNDLALHDPQTQIDFENEGGETYICGNPPYLGSTWQSDEQKSDLKAIFDHRTKTWKSLDYVAGWFMKAADYITHTDAEAAFVSTNSICQGRQVATLWSLILQNKCFISFAHSSFKWANLASYNAGVTVAIIAIAKKLTHAKKLFSLNDDGKSVTIKQADNINPYLVAADNVLVEATANPLSNQIAAMSFGNMPNDGGHLLLSQSQANKAISHYGVDAKFIRPFIGSQEFIRGQQRYCLWVTDEDAEQAKNNEWLNDCLSAVYKYRMQSQRDATIQLANMPHKFGHIAGVAQHTVIVVPSVSSERRYYLPVGLLDSQHVVSNLAFALYDAPLWNMSLIASRLHLVWIATVCGKLKTDFRYSNTLGWNTFPVPFLTTKNKDDLTECAQNILLAREMHFPATIADLYDPKNMPENLRHAHERNDEVLERIYIGRRFKNDTERLEKLFDLYTKMTTQSTVADALKKRDTK